MKTKILIPFFAFFVCTSTLFAQPKTFNVGIDFIPNYSFSLGGDQNVYIDDYYYGYNSGSNSREKKPSIAFGVVLSYQLSNKWSFESGLKYVNRGHKGTGNNYNYRNDGFLLLPYGGPTNTLTSVDNYNYLSVPLNVRLALGNDCNKGWYIRFGVSADFYLSSKSNYKYTDNEGEKREGAFDNNEDIRKTHLNLNYGVGYSFLIENNYQLSIEPAFDYMFYRLYHKGNNFNYNSAGIKLRLMIL